MVELVVEPLFGLERMPTKYSATITTTSTPTIAAHGGISGPSGARSRSRPNGAIGRGSWSGAGS